MLEKILHIQSKEANSNISGGETRDKILHNIENDMLIKLLQNFIQYESLRQILDCIYDGRVPIDWTKFSWESSALGFRFSELLDRYTQYNDWLNYGFLTAMRQEVTRIHPGWSLDTVTIDNIVLRSYKDAG
ncbi:unnamed protein product [Rotaria magnacalcarata]|uniref:Dynein heavy chain C-terminal domain-containing protein n=1 Tax=Rotaria magnacalcarata TaxID=392030 RepID=A0A817A1Q4_9BILA|nr:unnamed protein product [Rotaria magnacalcarata]CAF4106953.1 unnamed protein product [Rotaria magnacalcarata]